MKYIISNMWGKAHAIEAVAQECKRAEVVLGQFYIKNAGIYPENNVVLESMIICEFETKQ